VLTLGAKGAVAATSAEAFRAAALKVEPVDTTGAGDAFAWRARGVARPRRRPARGAGGGQRRRGPHLRADRAQTAQPTRAMIEARLPALPQVERV
jgi:ribokinase